MSGAALTVPFTSFVSQSHAMSQTQQFSVNNIRSLTRLKSMFISFYVDAPLTSIPNTVVRTPALPPMFIPTSTEIAGNGDTTTNVRLRPFNRFYHPMGQDDGNNYCSPYELQWHVSIGSLTFPVYPCRSTAETFYRLKQSLGILLYS